MLVLITGGCKSGKSSAAEKILTAFSGQRFYIATMEPFGAEAEEAIYRHRKMREGKNFTTIEKYTNIGEMTVPKKSGVLLECMCNLCANEMFSKKTKNPAEKIICDVKKISKITEIFVAVTNQVGSDGIEYPQTTMEYIRQMGLLNQGLADISDIVIETVFGITVPLKGVLPECLL